ncbi:glycosyltransferase family 4 protein [Microvirga brassicacearum]|uniref:Glycosyltransferase family 4 protein n=1 Tax=Microvirga brassicacearum TaxID=2580413 RepID=A0A5N3PJ63_9HYPH|nr:glycosyltransferase family 4 protein [Microvirga brassicacearum]KAB0269772.1 glycosyltransferase family 4 protein [Microvirga brassicacearum]
MTSVVFPFVGGDMGGSHVSAFTLGRALQEEHGIRCSVLCSARTLVAEQADKSGFAVVATGEPPTYRHHPAYDAVRFADRWRIVRELATDCVVHFNDLAAVQSWGPVARLAGRPILYHHRSLNRMTLPKRLLVNLAHEVVCISQACEHNVEFVAPGRRTLVLNPIHVSGNNLLRREARRFAAEIGCSRQGPLIGFVSNFWFRKRSRYFLEVCARLASARPDCHFVVFGRNGDETEDDLMGVAKELGIAHRVTFAGFRLPGERNIAALDLLLATSVNEPFGRTLVEAAIVGTPYLATDDAGHREIWNRWRGGRLAEIGVNPDEFASLALDILREPEAVILGQHERGQIAEDVSARTHARRIIEIYRRLEAPKPGLAQFPQEAL